MVTIGGEHKAWLDNEYQEWVTALNTTGVHTFKDHPQVRRMLSIGLEFPVDTLSPLDPDLLSTLFLVDDIGYRETHPTSSRGDLRRMVYYAQKIMARNPASIMEIGGGCGEFFAVMRVLGYQGEYCIMDLGDVEHFQARYLRRVKKLTGHSVKQTFNLEFCVSLYALGEFDTATRDWYIEKIVKLCSHGFLLWNPHSGADPTVNFPCSIHDENPLLNEGNKQLEW
jgi:hypothetical protein